MAGFRLASESFASNHRLLALFRAALYSLSALVVLQLGLSIFIVPVQASELFSDDIAALKPVGRQEPVSPAPAPTPTVLECFQVAQPVLTPNGPSTSDPSDDSSSCTVLLMEHVFAFSYGMPFVGNYTPPNCAFNRVVMNFTAVSQGRQFDRLALMYFGDTEVWRTSTAEPTQPPGIHWTYLKDMTEYLYFWKSPQTLIFDLGNLIDDKYTGPFNTTLSATFFMSDVDTSDSPPADLIIPISARKGATNEVSQFTLPLDNATNTFAFPQNANRAVFTVSANGQATEEFWWANVLQSSTLTFNDTSGALYGLSPFREVQVLIDGNVAGVDWPFPVIFTGGVVPSLHRPIVGLQAFDLREHQIDITPFLPLLCDGAEHTFTIRVAGIADDGRSTGTLTETVNDSWYVTGKIFVWLDDEGSVTTGTPPAVQFGAPAITFSQATTQNATGSNDTLTFNLVVARSVTVTSVVKSQKGDGAAMWSQSLSYTNGAVLTDFGYTQFNNFNIDGTDTATAPNVGYKSVYSYPLKCNQTYSVSDQGNLTIEAHLIEGLELRFEGQTVFPTGLEAFAGKEGVPKFAGSSLKTRRDGTASFFQTGDGKNSSGFGSTNQVFTFGGYADGEDVEAVDELYFRNVTAVNQTLTSNTERVLGVDGPPRFALPVDADKPDGAAAGFAEVAVARGGLVGQKHFVAGVVNGEKSGYNANNAEDIRSIYFQSP